MRSTNRGLAALALLSTLVLGAAGCGRAALRPVQAPVDLPAASDLAPWSGVVRVAASDLAAVERLDDAAGLVASVVEGMVEPLGLPVTIRCLELRRSGSVSSVIHAEVEVGFPEGGKETHRAAVAELLAGLAPTATAFDLPSRPASGLVARAGGSGAPAAQKGAP